MSKNRRLKLLFLSPEKVLACFSPINLTAGWVYNRITFPDLPANAVVLAINHDFQRQMFAVTVTHESFDEIPEGGLLPIIESSSTRLEPQSTWLEKGAML